MKSQNSNFESYIRSAEGKSQKAEEMKGIINNAFSKVMDIDTSSDQLRLLVKKVMLFIKMLQSYISGDYKNIPLRSIVSLAASLLYFINPFDLIPDMIPGIGLLDDLAVMIWVSGNIEKDIRDYEEFIKGNLESERTGS
jgi:uncharacterized membrane protein YkvA (DUF1232 family)